STPPALSQPYTPSLHDALPISVLPGATAMRMLNLLGDSPSAKGGPAIYENGAMAVPISLVPNTPSTSAKTSLAELDRRGEFLARSEVHTSELQSRSDLVCRLLL